MTVKITMRPNGPYKVEDPDGAIELIDPTGKKIDLTGKPVIALCRCGASVNKPFCDGVFGCPIQARLWLEWGSFFLNRNAIPGHVSSHPSSRPILRSRKTGATSG